MLLEILIQFLKGEDVMAEIVYSLYQPRDVHRDNGVDVRKGAYHFANFLNVMWQG